MFQPMIILLGAIRFNTTVISDKLLWIVVILCSIPIMYSDYLSHVYNRKLCSLEYEGGQLNWDLEGKYNKDTLYHTHILDFFYIGGIIIPWFFIKNKRLRNIFIVMIFTSLVLSKLIEIYKTGKIGISNNIIATWESTWCWFGSIVPIIMYSI